MKIRKLHLKNIGVFDDQEIVFQPCKAKDKAEIHIFTGQNGSGKTTILETLTSVFHELPLNSALYKRFRDFENEGTKHFTLTGNDTFLSTIKVNLDSHELFELRGNRRFKNSITNDINSYRNIGVYRQLIKATSKPDSELEFAAFAFSGSQQVKGKPVEAIYEPKDFNPLSQSLEFVKDYSQPNQISINQLIANNFSKRWIESSRDRKKSEKFKQVLLTIEQTISEITGWQIEFDLQTEPLNLIAKINGEDLDFDVLPDGLRSLISWMADLLGRVDLLKWQDNLPINEKNLILFLDEIEVHLHPAWQRKVLPVVQKLFKNSQIFISTHSPFVINSVDDAWVYKLELENGKARVADVVLSEDGLSYQTVLREIFGIDKRFGGEAQNKLDDFYRQRDSLLKANGKGKLKKKDFLKLAKDLASQSAELQSLVFLELARLSKETGEPYEI